MAGYVLLVFLLSPVCVWTYSPNYRYLSNYCGPSSTLSFSRDVILEYSSYSTAIPSDYSCKLTISNTDSSRQVQIRFRYLDIRVSSDCALVGLRLSEGATPLTPKNGVCGGVRPSTIYRTVGSQVTVELVNNGRSTYADFELLLTSFYHPGLNSTSCRGGDFLCNNGICVSNSVTCNGYNDCGDNSDEVEGCSLAAGVIVGIVFGVIVFVVVLSVLGVCVRRRRRSYIRVTETVREYPTVQRVPPGGYVPSYASQTGGYQAI